MSGNDSKNKIRSVRIYTYAFYALEIEYDGSSVLSFWESVVNQRLGPPCGATLIRVLGLVTGPIDKHPTQHSINMGRFTIFKHPKMTQL